ncbi:MAG: hypothetical protein QM813_21345 [Verrucomicrobiota bacterium]
MIGLSKQPVAFPERDGSGDGAGQLRQLFSSKRGMGRTVVMQGAIVTTRQLIKPLSEVLLMFVMTAGPLG